MKHPIFADASLCGLLTITRLSVIIKFANIGIKEVINERF